MKKRKDKKYQKSDKKICDFSNEILRKEARKIDIRNAEIYRGAKVSRATFSRHYSNVSDVKIREEERVFDDFRRQIKPSDGKDMVVFKFVLTIYKNKSIFLTCIKRNDVFLLKKLVHKMNRLVTRDWRSYGAVVDAKYLRWSSYLIIAAVEEWARKGFRGDLLEEEAHLIKKVYDFLEKNQGELARIFKIWGKEHSRQKRKIVV